MKNQGENEQKPFSFFCYKRCKLNKTWKMWIREITQSRDDPPIPCREVCIERLSISKRPRDTNRYWLKWNCEQRVFIRSYRNHFGRTPYLTQLERDPELYGLALKAMLDLFTEENTTKGECMNTFQKKIILAALADADPLTDWEFDFIEDLADKDDDYIVSIKQNVIINRIGQKYL